MTTILTPADIPEFYNCRAEDLLLEVLNRMAAALPGMAASTGLATLPGATIQGAAAALVPLQAAIFTDPGTFAKYLVIKNAAGQGFQLQLTLIESEPIK